jgi:hypothetical protein
MTQTEKLFIDRAQSAVVQSGPDSTMSVTALVP